MTRLSVIIPTHETRALTLRCVGSVLASGARGESGEGSEGVDGEAVEIVVVDDASSDGTVQALREKYPQVRVEVLAARSGFTVAVNRGLAAASGEVLLLLNSDTVVEPGVLAALSACFAERGELGAVGAQLLDPDGAAQWSGGREPTLAWLFVLAADLAPALARLPGYRRRRPLGAAWLRPVDWVTGAALGLRRSAWEAVGPFDEGFLFYGQDLDYCCRLRRAGWGVAIDPRVRVVHERGATIGRVAGATEGRNLALLFSDLELWGRKQRGPRWAAAARLVLRAGAGLRLRRRWRGFVGSAERRRAWRAERAAVRAALLALREGPPPLARIERMGREGIEEEGVRARPDPSELSRDARR
jgi:hypothetical protein